MVLVHRKYPLYLQKDIHYSQSWSGSNIDIAPLPLYTDMHLGVLPMIKMTPSLYDEPLWYPQFQKYFISIAIIYQPEPLFYAKASQRAFDISQNG